MEIYLDSITGAIVAPMTFRYGALMTGQLYAKVLVTTACLRRGGYICSGVAAAVSNALVAIEKAQLSDAEQDRRCQRAADILNRVDLEMLIDMGENEIASAVGGAIAAHLKASLREQRTR